MENWKVGPAYRIETDRLIIRCYNPEDADLLAKSVKESLDHLKPWMPWVHSEPEPIETKINRLRLFRAKFDLNKEFVFGIFNLEETELIGGCGFHPRIGHVAIEIGYWINVNHIRKGFGTECAGALTKIGFKVQNLKRLEIHCDPENIASASIPKKLGYTHDATLRKRKLTEKNELRDAMIWSMFVEEFEKAPVSDMPLKAYNAVGNQIL